MGVRNTTPFPALVSQFIEQYCEVADTSRKISDNILFTKFREYWKRVAGEETYPALLGQFRVEMVQQGYQSSDGKWPQWYGLALRRKKKAKTTPVIQSEASKGTTKPRAKKKSTGIKTNEGRNSRARLNGNIPFASADHQSTTPRIVMAKEYSML